MNANSTCVLHALFRFAIDIHQLLPAADLSLQYIVMHDVVLIIAAYSRYQSS